MNAWTEFFTRVLTWKGALPKPTRLRRIYIHFSALLALPIAGIALAFLPYVAPLDGDWAAAAITVPLIWLGSLSIRILAQWLAIGSHGDDFELVVGPAGNLSYEYEQLSGPTMVSYAVAGQSATMIMGLMGVLVLGTTAGTPGPTVASLLDFHTGWSAAALASQLVWVNGFLFLLHLLPAAPFDARALYVGWCHVSHPAMSPAAVHRSLATTDSHLGTGMACFALAMVMARMAESHGIGLWHVLLVVSIYLLSVSQFEAYQAQQQDELLEPPTPRVRRVGTKYQNYNEFPDFVPYEEATAADAPSPHEILDIDEILRKLHREGQDALSAFEKEALLSASRELQARRQSGT